MTITEGANRIKIQLIAQVAMIMTPIILSAAVMLITGYINGIEERVSSLETVTNILDRRVTVVEQAIITGRAARERFEASTTAKLDRLQDGIGNLSSSVSGLAATMNERRP